MFGILRQAISSSNFDFGVLISYFISAAVVIFICTPVHEYAHAVTAVKLGDPTPKYSGRTTINPIAHIDWIGALLILLFGFGYARPVQVNLNNFKKPKRDMAITAIAGPLSNIIMAFIFYVINLLVIKLGGINVLNSPLNLLTSFCVFIVQINISLAVFNLMPIPPLDGSRLLSSVLSDRNYYKLMRYERYFYLALIFLLFTGALDYPLSGIQAAIFNLFDFLTFWI